VDAAIACELLRAMKPMAIEAALKPSRHMELQGERRRIVELKLQQAHYEAACRTTLSSPTTIIIRVRLSS